MKNVFLLFFYFFVSQSSYAQSSDHLSEIRVRIANSTNKSEPTQWVEFMSVLALGQSTICYPQNIGVQKGEGRYRDCAVTEFKGDISNEFFGFRIVFKLSSAKNIYVRIEKGTESPIIILTENSTTLSDEIIQNKYWIQTEKIPF